MTFDYYYKKYLPNIQVPSYTECIIHTTAIHDILSCLSCVLIVEATMFSTIFTNSLLNRHKEMFSVWKSFHHSSCNFNKHRTLKMSTLEHFLEIKYMCTEFLPNNCLYNFKN